MIAQGNLKPDLGETLIAHGSIKLNEINTYRLTSNFTCKNGIMIVINNINTGNQATGYLQFKDIFDHGCFPNSRGRTKWNYFKEIACRFLF